MTFVSTSDSPHAFRDKKVEKHTITHKNNRMNMDGNEITVTARTKTRCRQVEEEDTQLPYRTDPSDRETPAKSQRHQNLYLGSSPKMLLGKGMILGINGVNRVRRAVGRCDNGA